MDSLTQVIVGGIIGEKTLGKEIGNKAILWGFAIGTLPDLDVFLSPFYNTVDNLFIHRGISHSLLFTVLLSPLIAYLFKKLYSTKSVTFKQWWTYSQAILFGAVFVDYLTGYGASIFWPFSGYRIELNTIAIVDIFFTLPLLIMLILLFAKRKSSRRILRNTAIIFGLSYILITGSNKLYINSTFRQQLSEQQLSYNELITAPLPLTNFLWMGLAKTRDGYRLGYYSLFDESDIDFTYIKGNHHLLSKYQGNKKIQKLLEFTKGFYKVENKNSELLVHDLRFGKMGIKPEADYIFSFQISENEGKVVIKEKERGDGFSSGEFKNFLRRIFSHTKNKNSSS